MFYFRRPEAGPNLDNMSSIPRFNLYTFRFFKFLSSIQVTYKGLQRHNGFVSLPWPQVDIDRSATLNILELKKSGDLWQVSGSGYYLWESGWNKEPFCIHMLLCVQCWGWRHWKFLGFSWIALGWNHRKKKTYFLLPNQVMPGVDSKVLLDFSASFFKCIYIKKI